MHRVAAISDTHCGHVVGLTPPDYWLRETPRVRKLARLQRECWAFYRKHIEAIKPIDTLFFLGDGIDGKGRRSGGTELLTTDRHAQCDMAADCINLAEARHVVMVFGTGYHVGDDEDFENEILKRVKADKIGSHEWVEIEGWTFDLKHYTTTSGVERLRHGKIANDREANLYWALEREQQPLADVYLRGHIHAYTFAGGPKWSGWTLPALQAAGTKFGARKCKGTVDFGFLHFDIEKGQRPWPTEHLAELKHQRAKAMPLT